MLNIFRSKRSSVFVWIIVGLLIIGLAGFGIGTSGGLSSQDVARVGEERVPAEEYAQALDQDMRNLTAQTGQSFTMEQARAFGIDRVTLLRLVNNAALDGEAKRLGISVGDAAIREQLQQISAFRTADGFSREAYLNALNRIGTNTADFETSIREDVARSIFLNSVISSAAMPGAAADALTAYVGEERSFDWVMLSEVDLIEPLAEADEAELEAFHEENQDRYMKPETQRVSYAIASPEALAQALELPEDELRAVYEAERSRFEVPERRLLERIGFGTEAEAEDAMARIEAGEATFDDIAGQRGLVAADMDMGLVPADRLLAEAREIVFGITEPGVVGPAPSPLGPSLYRVNAIFEAQVTPFEEAREDIRQERALDEAEISIRDDLPHIEDLIAGGATLEEIADETIMELGETEVSSESTGPIATDPNFREALADAREAEETDLVELEDGSFVTLRLEGTDPASPLSLDEVRTRVADDLRAERLRAALGAEAEALVAELEAGTPLAEVAEGRELDVFTAGPMARSDEVPAGAPAGLVEAVFEAEEGGVASSEGDGTVAVAHVTEILPYDGGEGELLAFRDEVAAQLDAQVQEDLRMALVGAIRDDVGVRLNQEVIDATLEQFQ
ncbi:SurA N-terminal domain-containing protein [Amaricoccus macauensis]|uniref:peptidylprolyl isomerase n=1 Tax=Amaricoccus macauensis TaxID=57001 RepID=UPI003C7CFD8C